MVGHENPGMYGNVKFGGAITDTIRKRSNICITGETDVAVVTALDDVDSVSGRAESESARHRCIVKSFFANEVSESRKGLSETAVTLCQMFLVLGPDPFLNPGCESTPLKARMERPIANSKSILCKHSALNLP